MSEKIYFHAFNLIPQFGPVRVAKLLKYFKNLEQAWQADTYYLSKAGLSNSIIYHLLEQKRRINPEQEYEKIDPNVKIITIKNKHYPKQLKQIHTAPFILYIRGSDSILEKPSLAIVGTRKMSEYGQRVCEQLSEQLTQLGFTIISGLAEGVDTIAHQACLDNNGNTVAVLGSGINDNCIFPANNKKLVEDIIINNGAVISEYPPHIKAQRNFFPARNRIVSGLSLGTIVIEAPKKSGALITAYKALEQNREVFAVPGSIYSSRSCGCNNIIKKGAKLVATCQDILDELFLDINTKPINSKTNFQLTFNEQKILKYIDQSGQTVDKIIKSCRLNRSIVLATITMLELKGIIKKINNHHYILCQKI